MNQILPLSLRVLIGMMSVDIKYEVKEHHSSLMDQYEILIDDVLTSVKDINHNVRHETIVHYINDLMSEEYFKRKELGNEQSN